MLIILNLLGIFAHPVKGLFREKTLIIFDNSVYSGIRMEDGKTVFQREVEILEKIRKPSDRILYLTDKNYEISSSAEGIEIINRPFQLPIPAEIEKKYNTVIISPFVDDFGVEGRRIPVYPGKFTNAGMTFVDYSVLKGELVVRVYTTEDVKKVNIMSSENGKSRLIQTRDAPGENIFEVTVDYRLEGRTVFEVHPADADDDFLADNEFTLDFPEGFRLQRKYSTPALNDFLGVISKRVNLNGERGLVISDVPSDKAGIYFLPEKDTRRDTLAVKSESSALVTHPVTGSSVETGRSVLESLSGAVYGGLEGDRLIFGFLPEGVNRSILKTESGLYILSSVLDRYFKGFVEMKAGYTPANEQIKFRVKKGEAETDIPKRKGRDYRYLLILLFPLLMIAEILI